MKPDSLLKVESALRELREESPLNTRALYSLTINVGTLAEAMRNKQARRVRSLALILAAQAIRIAEEGDPVFEFSGSGSDAPE